MKPLPILAFAILAGCTTKNAVLPESVNVPAKHIDTVYVAGPERVIMLNPGCDTTAILEALCRGEAIGEQNGIEWKFKYQTLANRVVVMAQEFSRVKTEYQVQLNEAQQQVKIPPEYTKEMERLKANQEKHGVFWLIGFAVAFCALGFVASKAATLIKPFI